MPTPLPPPIPSTPSSAPPLSSLDDASLDDVAGGCAACGIPGAVCQAPIAAPTTGAGTAALLSAFMRR